MTSTIAHILYDSAAYGDAVGDSAGVTLLSLQQTTLILRGFLKYIARYAENKDYPQVTAHLTTIENLIADFQNMYLESFSVYFCERFAFDKKQIAEAEQNINYFIQGTTFQEEHAKLLSSLRPLIDQFYTKFSLDYPSLRLTLRDGLGVLVAEKDFLEAQTTK
jgi:hypothetical protein